MRLVVFLGSAREPVRPVGHRHHDHDRSSCARRRCAVAAEARRCSASRVAVFEVFVAKLRLFRVPELLAASFVLAFLAVTASFFLA